MPTILKDEADAQVLEAAAIKIQRFYRAQKIRAETSKALGFNFSVTSEANITYLREQHFPKTPAMTNLYFTLLGISFDFYHVTKRPIEGEKLWAPAAQQKDEDAPPFLSDESRAEQYQVFGWWLPRGTQYPNKGGQRIYIFDGDQLIKHVGVTIKGQDPVVFEHAKTLQTNIKWNGTVWGNVYRCVEITPKGNKKISLVNAKGKSAQYFTNEYQQIFQGRQVPKGLALDIVQTMQQIKALDPESASKILEFFTDEYSQQHDPEFVKAQRTKRATEIYRRIGFREATVEWCLPFQTCSGENLLLATQSNLSDDLAEYLTGLQNALLFSELTEFKKNSRYKYGRKTARIPLNAILPDRTNFLTLASFLGKKALLTFYSRKKLIQI